MVRNGEDGGSRRGSFLSEETTKKDAMVMVVEVSETKNDYIVGQNVLSNLVSDQRWHRPKVLAVYSLAETEYSARPIETESEQSIFCNHFIAKSVKNTGQQYCTINMNLFYLVS
jgi:hypothetical protein